MKMCQEHWDALKTAINDAGLEQFVTKSGAVVVAKMTSEAESGLNRTNFEPLMGAHNSIVSNALSLAGLAVMQDNEDGTERCPLCYTIANCMCNKGDGCHVRKWIEYSARDARNAAIRLGLIASA